MAAHVNVFSHGPLLVRQISDFVCVEEENVVFHFFGRGRDSVAGIRQLAKDLVQAADDLEAKLDGADVGVGVSETVADA